VKIIYPDLTTKRMRVCCCRKAVNHSLSLVVWVSRFVLPCLLSCLPLTPIISCPLHRLVHLILDTSPHGHSTQSQHRNHSPFFPRHSFSPRPPILCQLGFSGRSLSSRPCQPQSHDQETSATRSAAPSTRRCSTCCQRSSGSSRSRWCWC
jgi:hypothetical protein